MKKRNYPLSTIAFVPFILLALVMYHLAGSGRWFSEDVSAQQPRVTANSELSERLKELDPEERINVQVYEKNNKSVVNIDTKSVQRTFSFFSTQIESEERGSGIVFDKSGHILTNFHVIEGAESIQVTLFNGMSFPAEKIGEDPRTDIAVLKISAAPEELYPVVLGDSASLLVGQKVFAIGNPFGLDRTLTSGIISSLNRTIGSRMRYRPIKQAIQIDAAINPGNSGGPLLDSRGRMIGMNTAIASRVGENSGVGFAIPSNTIRKIVGQLLKDGKIVRGEIGIAEVYQTEKGLLIKSLVPEGAAERAGLQGPKIVRKESSRGAMKRIEVYRDNSAADLIVAVDEQPVKTAEDFITVIEDHKSGDRVLISVIRDGKTVKIPVVLD